MIEPEDKDDRSALLRWAAENPDIVFFIKNSDIEVAGAWIERPKHNDYFCRVKPGEPDWNRYAAVAHKFWYGCDGILQPYMGDFGLGESYEYEEAEREYEEAVKKQKSWVWHVNHNLLGYADTKEEAMRLADEALVQEGYILSN